MATWSTLSQKRNLTRRDGIDFRVPDSTAPHNMRNLLFVAVLSLASLVSAQSQTGRHFQRESRLPQTPPATAAAEASVAKQAAAPLQKMRSGRAWPRFHFGRLPQAAPTGSVQAVDAAARSATAQRRGFWRAHG